MGLVLRVGGCFEVLQGDQVLGPPPSRTTGVALLFLGRRSGSWTARNEMARVLFDSQDSTARANSFRQTLFRLRRWLPPGAIETEQGQVRIVGPCQIDLRLPNGDQATGLQIAPLLDHPWLDTFRASLSPPRELPALHPSPLLRNVVLALADLDTETARQALVSLPLVTYGMPTAALTDLFSKTRPKSSREPFALEYEELRAAVAHRLGQLDVALRRMLQACRIAKRNHDYDAIARTSALAMFYRLEYGDLEGAEVWLSALTASDRTDATHLLILNAKAAYYWNIGAASDGLSIMKSGIGQIEKSSRVQRVHFYSNLAVLMAEAGDLDGVSEAINLAKSVAIPTLDLPFVGHWKLALAEKWIRQREPWRAQEILKSALADAHASENIVGTWYLREALAEATWLQDPVAGRLQWVQVEKERLTQCQGLTPRVQLRKRRIMGP